MENDKTTKKEFIQITDNIAFNVHNIERIEFVPNHSESVSNNIQRFVADKYEIRFKNGHTEDIYDMSVGNKILNILKDNYPWIKIE